MKRLLIIFTLLAGVASAEAQDGTAFPPSSVVATSAQLTAHLSGRTFRSVYDCRVNVQSKFGADGALTASAPGYYDTGTWRVEEGKLCGSLRRAGDFCNEARFDSGTLYLKRMNGEVVRYQLD